MSQTPNHRSLRDALGTFATGVTVITTRNEQANPVGVSVNSFNSLSLDPPLILFSLGRKNRSLEAFFHADRFIVNVLAENQAALARNFGRASEKKWAGVKYSDSPRHIPVLADILSYFECSKETTIDIGDHVLFVGRIDQFHVLKTEKPLIFYQSSYTGLSNKNSPAK